MKKLIALAGVLLFATAAQAQDYTTGTIRISQPWVRATAPGAKAGGGFLSLQNAGSADRLVSASAAVADVVELHTMSMEGGMMKMSKLDAGIELPAGKTVELKPGGLHIMFINLKAPLKEGSKFPLRLKFEKAGEITVDMKVESMTASGASATGADAHKHH